MSGRPFAVLGVQQIAVGGPDKARCGGSGSICSASRSRASSAARRENVDEDIAQAGAGPFAVEVDLMQPLDPEKRPKVHEPPLNHVGLWVDDLHAAVAWLGAARRALHARRHPQGRRRPRRLLHPSQGKRRSSPVGGEGVLIELVQAPPDVIAAFRREAAGR